MSQETTPIWHKSMSLEGLNATSRNTLMAHLDIVYTAFGPDWLEATMRWITAPISPLVCCTAALQ